MSLTAGTVSVSNAGTVSGSGAAKRLYDKRIAAAATAFPNGTIPPGIPGIKLKQAVAIYAQADAEWMVAEITTYAEAKIAADASGDGLQRTPNPNNADTATQRPASDKFLSIV